jgi:hypothetical protein
VNVLSININSKFKIQNSKSTFWISCPENGIKIEIATSWDKRVGTKELGQKIGTTANDQSNPPEGDRA